MRTSLPPPTQESLSPIMGNTSAMPGCMALDCHSRKYARTVYAWGFELLFPISHLLAMKKAFKVYENGTH